jgi:hypothetical protein
MLLSNNPKHEIQTPENQMIPTKIQFPIVLPSFVSSFGHLSFGIVSCFDIRISNFILRRLVASSSRPFSPTAHNTLSEMLHQLVYTCCSRRSAGFPVPGLPMSSWASADRRG